MRLSALPYGDAVVVLIGIATAFVMYTNWFRACCPTEAEAIGIALVPATLMASVLADGVHNAGVVSFSVGLVLELLIVWWILKFLFIAWRSQTRRG